MAAVGQRLSRRLTAGAGGLLDFELVDAGELVTDLTGAAGTADIRRSTTPPLDAELSGLPVVLDAAPATATLALTAAQTTALAPLAGARVGEISITVKVVTLAGLIHFHGPGERELWEAAG